MSELILFHSLQVSGMLLEHYIYTVSLTTSLRRFPVLCVEQLIPTDEDMDLTTLRVYVRRALGPRTQDADPDLYRHFDSPPALSPEP